MATTIKQRTIGGTPDNAIQLSNSQFGRLITLPASWSKVCVGVYGHFSDSGGALAGTPRLAIGLGRGVTNMVGSASTDHWVGAITTAASWARAATYYTVTTNNWKTAVKVGATLTVNANINAVQQLCANGAAGAGTDRQIWYVHITRGDPNYTIGLLAHNNNAAFADQSRTMFRSQVFVNSATPWGANYALWAGGTIPVDEATNGTFNAVQIWWDHSDAVFEICDLAVARMA